MTTPKATVNETEGNDLDIAKGPQQGTENIFPNLKTNLLQHGETAFRNLGCPQHQWEGYVCEG